MSKNKNIKKSTRIALLDSGLNPALITQFFSKVIVGDFTYGKTGEDIIGHGTSIARTLGENSDAVTLLSAKCFTHGFLIGFRALIDAVEWAVEMKADLILFPNGSSSGNQEFDRSLEIASERGVLIIAAIGNEGDLGKLSGQFPANYEKVISVGSVNYQDDLSVFSDFNSSMNLLAPGEDYLGYDENFNDIQCAGTSQAAAHVAGVVARVISECRSLDLEYDREKIIDLLNKTGRVCKSDIAGLPKIVDVDSALAHLRNNRSL